MQANKGVMDRRRLGKFLGLVLILIIAMRMPNALGQQGQTGATPGSIQQSAAKPGPAAQSKHASSPPLTREKCQNFLAVWHNAGPELRKFTVDTKIKCDKLLGH